MTWQWTRLVAPVGGRVCAHAMEERRVLDGETRVLRVKSVRIAFDVRKQYGMKTVTELAYTDGALK